VWLHRPSQLYTESVWRLWMWLEAGLLLVWEVGLVLAM
jgi:hypothetical protein